MFLLQAYHLIIYFGKINNFVITENNLIQLGDIYFIRIINRAKYCRYELCVVRLSIVTIKVHCTKYKLLGVLFKYPDYNTIVFFVNVMIGLEIFGGNILALRNALQSMYTVHTATKNIFRRFNILIFLIS